MRTRTLMYATVFTLLVAVVVGVYLHVGNRPVHPLPAMPAVSAIVRETSAAGQVIILRPKNPNDDLVVYAHGNGEIARSIYENPSVASLTTALLNAGYTVASSDAYGNAWGNAASVEAYAALTKETKKRFALRNVDMLSASMGSLAALSVAQQDHDVHNFAALFPVCDLSSLLNQVDIAAGVKASGVDVSAFSPVVVPSGLRMLMWASTGDTRVPVKTNAQKCLSSALENGDDATLVRTTGNHGDASNFDPARLVAFFNATKRR